MTAKLTPAQHALATAEQAILAARRDLLREHTDAARPFVEAMKTLKVDEALRAAAAALRFAEHLATEAGIGRDLIGTLIDEGRTAGKKIFVPAPPPPKGLSYKPGTKHNPTTPEA